MSLIIVHFGMGTTSSAFLPGQTISNSLHDTDNTILFLLFLSLYFTNYFEPESEDIFENVCLLISSPPSVLLNVVLLKKNYTLCRCIPIMGLTIISEF